MSGKLPVFLVAEISVCIHYRNIKLNHSSSRVYMPLKPFADIYLSPYVVLSFFCKYIIDFNRDCKA